MIINWFLGGGNEIAGTGDIVFALQLIINSFYESVYATLSFTFYKYESVCVKGQLDIVTFVNKLNSLSYK